MLLDVAELYELENSLRQEFDENLTGILTKLNSTGKLEDFLSLIGLSKLLNPDIGYQVYKTGKIIIIGQAEIKKDKLLAIGDKLGIDKNRFELYLEYEDAKKFNFAKTQWSPSYAIIMVGPMPHSVSDKDSYSSIIAAIENKEGYPPIIRLGTKGLKITKSDFKNKLEWAISEGLICCN